MPHSQFTAESLPAAVASLFRLNNYAVSGPTQLHGAEIDLVATPLQPFSAKVYVEVTVEYVNNDKYGKDVGKLAMIGHQEPSSRRLIVSSNGFSSPVRERAMAAGIELYTYEALYSEFQRFDPYVTDVLGDGSLGTELAALDAIYEEPLFSDEAGTELATHFLDGWLTTTHPEHRWLIVVGEYGTGKTALTKILQRRWTTVHQKDPLRPIPFRIELRDFARQFSADGLLHHFLDHHKLGHLPLEFVLSLIREGRVVLLLDGYDEMAQFLNSRERRYCLEALARLSSHGAKGIVTSRPNYFSEAEELQVFEVLYREISTQVDYMTTSAKLFFRQEREVDDLIETHILERYERSLRDLTPAQTRELVKRVLPDDAAGQAIITNILDRVYRAVEHGDQLSLSGKPVIVSYLFEILDQLKGHGDASTQGQLAEWDIYQLIVDQLMLRDLARSPRIHPQRRREFLQSLSIWLSRKGHSAIEEPELRDLVHKEFRIELRGADKAQQLESLVEDLRSSTTLTRSSSGTERGWRFSHNSLREFLLAERMLAKLAAGEVLPDRLAITDGMRLLVASRDAQMVSTLVDLLSQRWAMRADVPTVGQLLGLLWDAGRQALGGEDRSRALLSRIGGEALALNGAVLDRLTISTEQEPSDLRGAQFSSTELSHITLQAANLSEANFDGAILDGCSLAFADASGASFRGALLIEVDLRGTILANALFNDLDHESVIIVETPRQPEAATRLEGEDAVAYLRFRGAATDEVDPFRVFQHDPRFAIVEKVVAKLAEQRNRQRRGLEQRGAARANIGFARDLIAEFERQGWVASPAARKDMLGATAIGRDVFAAFVEGRELHAALASFLEATMVGH